jgi:hypothetical protein
MTIKEIGFETVYWIHLAQDRVQWRALVNTAMDMTVFWVFGPCSLVAID